MKALLTDRQTDGMEQTFSLQNRLLTGKGLKHYQTEKKEF